MSKEEDVLYINVRISIRDSQYHWSGHTTNKEMEIVVPESLAKNQTLRGLVTDMAHDCLLDAHRAMVEIHEAPADLLEESDEEE